MSEFCSLCEKLFNTRSSLTRHNRDVHKKYSNYVEYHYPKNFVCLECNLFFHVNQDLRCHLTEKHNRPTELLELHFEKFTDFTMWMSQMEKDNNVQYCKVRGTKRANNKEKYYFSCIRSHGNYTIKDNRKRALKSQGSCKMQFSCTSQVILSRDTLSDQCVVLYYKTHYGHGEKIQHLHLTRSDKDAIASKLIIGVPSKSIINTVRDNIGKDLKRLDLLTREDIRNVKNSYGIVSKEGCRHKDDATSVHLWVSECLLSDSSPILFYKQQGVVMEDYPSLKANDFCLILMNTIQKEILLKFGSNLIAIDGTHGLNPYDFELTTVLVKDEFRNGFPVAFMFSNRKDTLIYEVLFSKIKEVVGIIKTKAFMSDITNTFYNAWCSVMACAKNRLFCSWHVDRAWQSNLGKIADAEKKSYTYKMLKELHYILDPEKFIESINSFLEKLLGDPDTYNFGTYFSQNYCNNFNEWAYCYRKGCGINTNMSLESFHRILKYFYLDGKKMKRLDKSIHQLLVYLRDKTVERIIKLKKGKSVETVTNSRHRAALTSSFVVSESETNIFKLVTNNESYIVERQDTVNCCEIKCNFCKICIHAYKCNCLDFLIRATICKHVHYVALQDKTVYIPNNNLLVSSTEPVTNEIQQLVAQVANQKDTDTLKEQVKQKALSILQIVDSKNVTNDQLKLMLEHLNTVLAVSTIPDEKFISENSTVHNEPANKNISKQKSFYSTKKQKKKNNYLSKCTPDEQILVREMINNDIAVSCNSLNDHQYL